MIIKTRIHLNDVESAGSELIMLSHQISLQIH